MIRGWLGEDDLLHCEMLMMGMSMRMIAVLPLVNLFGNARREEQQDDHLEADGVDVDANMSDLDEEQMATRYGVVGSVKRGPG